MNWNDSCFILFVISILRPFSRLTAKIQKRIGTKCKNQVDRFFDGLLTSVSTLLNDYFPVSPSSSLPELRIDYLDVSSTFCLDKKQWVYIFLKTYY